VDDAQIFRDVASRALSKAGYSVRSLLAFPAPL